MAGDLPDALHADPAVAAPGWRPARPGDTPGQLAPELRDLPEGQQSTALAALVAQVVHKALDDVDEGWHLSCLEPDADEGSGSCFKGHAARRMLEEDVAPKVVDALAARVRADVAEDLWREAQRLRDEDWPAKVGIEYVEGFEAAVGWIERQTPSPPAESVVGAPSPVSAPSDVAAPRDALTDQDFADLNETIADLRDAAWRAYLAEDDVSAAVNAAVRTAVVLTNRRWIAARERVQTRHASRPDGYCVMCRWPDGSLMRWPCPDYVDAGVGALPEDEGTRQEGLINGD